MLFAVPRGANGTGSRILTYIPICITFAACVIIESMNREKDCHGAHIHTGAPHENILGGIVEPLLSWYGANARPLPWRASAEPYGVWVSEIMLQQTQAETVIPYYLRFMRALPDIKSLAEAKEDALMKLWEGLGYYARARNMQKAARVITERHGGIFPENHADILALPGVGPYTAGAIASICFGEAVPAVDGNVLRVVARLTDDARDITLPATRKAFSEMLADIYPERRSGDFMQSLMELGAVVCLPNGAPKCAVCPLCAVCRAYAAGKQLCLPVKAQKPPRRKEDVTVFIMRCNGSVAVQKRPAGKLLGGMWEYPNACGALNEEEAARLLAEWGVKAESITKSVRKKHIFTHIEWDMSSYIVDCENAPQPFVWTPKEALITDIALPSAFRSFTDLV